MRANEREGGKTMLCELVNASRVSFKKWLLIIHTKSSSCLPTFMIAYRLNIYRMKPFPIHIVGFVVVRCNNANVGPVHTSNHARKASLAVKSVFVGVHLGCCCGPLYEHFLFSCKQLWNMLYCSRGGWLVNTFDIANYLQKAAACKKS